MKKKRIAILGSTGSIGTQALEVIDKLPGLFEIVALSGGDNIQLLKKQADKYKPRYICVKQEIYKSELSDVKAEILYGDEGLKQISSLSGVDLILVALSGKTGLIPTITGIKNKKDIALANKEALVMAGDIVMTLARKNNVKILPVDSEHSAIFQCIANEDKYIKNLIITASGGPFLNTNKEELKNADITQTLNHPRWKMGKKITVDSATLMNKGLEVIEAHHLFNIDYDNIKVVIHPQSYLHSAVEFTDGSIKAQIGTASMHIPIQYSLTYPERFKGIKSESFDFIKAGKFEFYEVDNDKFPFLNLAIQSGRTGGTASACLNAANEEAVFAFLDNKIKYTDIYKITNAIYKNCQFINNPSLEEILEEDKRIRRITREYISKISD